VTITYSDDFERYHDVSEANKIKKAVESFSKRVQSFIYSDQLNCMGITISINNTIVGPDNKPVPAQCNPSTKLIEFNLELCKHEYTVHYSALFAHEVGHMFPQIYPELAAFQSEMIDPDINIHIQKFEANKPSFMEYVADYYACVWGFYKETVQLRKTRGDDDDYINVLSNYNNEDQYRIAAFKDRLQRRATK
jgi:hypothetical protein